MSKYDDLEATARKTLKSLEDAKSQKECAEYRPVIFNPETIIELIEIAKAAENMLLSTNRWEQQTLALRLAKLLGNPVFILSTQNHRRQHEATAKSDTNSDRQFNLQ
ncbi:hypothetical protein [Hafnia paralvei]|mgnify:CR=1 FL=1|uniref:hypothetical protein n=2 Tax=Hafnia paralvei TaxID=546367 RepID=UPI00117A0015|nr:hypothetical protein [Hafnia paralvei]